MSKATIYDIQFPDNPKKIKFTILSYLYEIAAIPEKVRLEYLNKLLKRRNASSQKNVELLNIIYYHIKEDKMLEWNDLKICRMLNISKNMLYCHKSRLLKSLRLLHFEWNKIERKEFSELPKTPEGEIVFRYSKIDKMIKIGMWREAKNECLKLEKILESRSKLSPDEKLKYANLLKVLVSYYYHRENSLRFNIYFKKSEKLNSTLNKSKSINSNQKFKLTVALMQNSLKAYESFFKLRRNTNKETTFQIFEKIRSTTKKLKNNSAYASVLLDTGVFHQTQHSYEKALNYYDMGERFCLKHNLEIELLVFRMYKLLVKLLMGKLKREYVLEQILKNYKRLEELNIQGYMKERALINCNELTSVSEDKNYFYKFLLEYNSHYILTYGYYGALRTLYFMKFAYYQYKIKMFRLEKYNGHKIPVLYDVNPVYKKKLANAVNEVLQNFDKVGDNRLQNVHFKWEALMAILDAEFWKGKDLNYDFALYIIQAMEWLRKSWGKLMDRDNNIYATLKLCIEMISDSKVMSKKDLLNKHEYIFRKSMRKIAETNNENVTGTYALCSYTAQIIGYKELKDIAAKTYLYLKQKRPKELKRLLTDITSGKTKTQKQKSFKLMESGILVDKAA